MHRLEGEHLEHEHVEGALDELAGPWRLLSASHRRLIGNRLSYQMSRGVADCGNTIVNVVCPG